MATYGRPLLRDLFDGAPTPHIAHPPRTHHRDFYVATDGSFVAGGGGLGAIVETGAGDRLKRLARHDDAPDNNVAEYRALQAGLAALSEYATDGAHVGVLVDHDALAANVNAAALGMAHPDWPASPVAVPEAGAGPWNEIRAHLARFADVRAACVDSDDNPAHALANAPDEYVHLDQPVHPSSPASRDWEAPPPSRANRHAADD